MTQLVLTNEVRLIGDFLGTIPAMIDLSKTVDDLYVINRPEVRELLAMIPRRYRIHSRLYDVRDKPSDFTIKVGPYDTQAYVFATKHGLYMTQAHYPTLGFPVPEKPVRPELMFPAIGVPVFDLLLAPFSVSLPQDQLWPEERWLELVYRMPHLSFAILGSQFEPKNYAKAPNVTHEYGRPFVEVCNIMQRARFGVISVVTGISHLAYALQVRNYLLEYQDTPWGKNPDSMRFHHPVTDISVNDVCSMLDFNEVPFSCAW